MGLKSDLLIVWKTDNIAHFCSNPLMCVHVCVYSVLGHSPVGLKLCFFCVLL